LWVCGNFTRPTDLAGRARQAIKGYDKVRQWPRAGD
jgi:hypothetical protein